MYCEYCGEKIPDGYKYCPNCGLNIKQNKSPQKNQENNGFSNFIDNWKEFGTGKKVLSLIACCCIGWIVISLIFAVITPDNNTDDFADDYNYSASSIDEPVNSSDTSDDVSDSSSDDVDSSDDSSDSDSSSSTSSTSGSYVGNSNTKKFHLPTCSYASKIKDSNKVYFNSRDDAIDNGYVPCKVCNP